MHEIPETRQTLLVRLRDASDQRAWEEFVELYQPVVYRLARSRGLQHADALDLVQDVLVAVAGAIDGWDPDPALGHFRSWLFQIARNLTVNALARGGRSRGSGDSGFQHLVNSLPAQPDADATLFDLEYRREAFARAAALVRESVEEATWQSFWLTSIEGLAIEEVAH